MDDQRFDDLARAVARSATRRGLLRGLVGGAAAGLPAALRPRRLGADDDGDNDDDDCKRAGRRCKKDGQCCHGTVCSPGGTCEPGCRIGGVFSMPGAPNPANPCESCQPAQRTGRFLAIPGCADALPLGAACAANERCRSGLCVDGVCCDGPCTGGCEACNHAGSVGTCAPCADCFVQYDPIAQNPPVLFCCPPENLCPTGVSGAELCCYGDEACVQDALGEFRCVDPVFACGGQFCEEECCNGRCCPDGTICSGGACVPVPATDCVEDTDCGPGLGCVQVVRQYQDPDNAVVVGPGTCCPAARACAIPDDGLPANPGDVVTNAFCCPYGARCFDGPSCCPRTVIEDACGPCTPCSPRGARIRF